MVQYWCAYGRLERAKKEPCDLCEEGTKTSWFALEPLQLAMHKNFFHPLKDPNDSSKLMCRICQLFTGKIDRLKMHIKMEHFNLKLPQCDVCLKYFNTDFNLKNHWQIASCKRDPIPCEHCDEKFLSKNDLRSHKVRIHGLSKKDIQYPCHICGVLSKSRANLRYHIEEVHKIGDKKIFCDQCAKQFSDTPAGLSKLKSHSDVHLSKTIKCTVDGCECMFASIRQLNRHILVCHVTKKKKKEKNHICDQCPKNFPNKRKLISHKAAIHNGPKPFKCKECDYECAYSNTMRQHVKSVHLNIMYDCIVPGCGKQMNEKGNMDKHMKTAHGIPLPSEQQNPRKRIDIGKTPFKCELCEFKGKNPRQIIKHKAVVHKVKKIIKCDKCGKVFDWLQSLRRHRLKC